MTRTFLPALCLALAACWTPAAIAQYMYLDANGDGVWTAADDLNANGIPTTVDVYLNTNHNRAGSLQTCNMGPEALNANSYVVNLTASNGTVTYSGFTNRQSGWTVMFGEINTGNGNYKNGFGGPAAGALAPGGPYILCTVTITGNTGAPSIAIVDQIPGSVDFTSFGTACGGNGFDSTYKLDGPNTQAYQGGGDWFDWDGLGAAGGGAPPVLAPIGNKTVNEGSCLTFTATASDPDAGQTLTFSLGAGAPAGASITAGGSFIWCPTEAQGPGSYAITVCVTDNAGGQDCETFTVTVLEVNTAPVLAPIGNRTVDEGIPLCFTVVATDGDIPANVLTCTITGAPSGATFNATTGVFCWTPTEAQGPGSYPITICCSDNGSPPLQDCETFTVTVNEVNSAPVLAAIGNRTGCEGQTLTFTATATDPNSGQTLTFSLTLGSPPATGATINASTGAFSWTPAEFQGPGVYPITVRVTDNGSPPLSDSETIQVSVNECHGPPVLAPIGNKTVDELSPLTFTATATDASIPAQTLTFSLDAGAPAGAAINATTGAFSWTPTEAQGPGVFPITVIVTNDRTPPASDSETIQVTVNEVNSAPVLAPIGDKSVCATQTLTFTATATDSDIPPNTLRCSLDPGAPSGASIDLGTCVFSWTPTAAQSGTYTVTVRVTDNGVPLMSDSDTIVITVPICDAPPVLSQPADMTVDEGATADQVLTATDPDNTPITFSKVEGPAFMTVTTTGPTTGNVHLEPGFTDRGLYPATVRATSGALSDQKSFQIRVAGECAPPRADAGGPYTGVAGAPVRFDGTGSMSPDGNPLTFAWDFGDGVTASGPSPIHTYALKGSYLVTLVVSDITCGTLDDDVTTADIVDFFPATAFTRGGNARTNLDSGKPFTCIQIQPDDASYSNTEIDLASIIMISEGTGSVSRITAFSGKTVVDADKNGDGIQEITACFAKEDLRLLFSNLPEGNQTVEVALEGNLTGGAKFRSTLLHTVKGGDDATLAASIAPNPPSPSATLTFRTSKPGMARVQLFDIRGRLIRTLMDVASAPVGYHGVRIDGRDAQRNALASGVYYVRIVTLEGSVTRGITILK